MMKKNIFFSLSAVLLLAAFASCVKKEEMQMKELNYSKKYYLNPDTSLGSLSVGIKVEIPEKFHNHEVMANIQKQIISKVFGEKYTNYSPDSVLPMYVRKLHQNYLKDYSPEFQELIKKNGGPSMINEINVEGVALFLDDKILSYSYESYAFLGGAHGNSSRFFYNFDLTDAHLIKEEELFHSNYQESLTQLIKEQIVAESAEIESVADLDNFSFWSDQIKPNGNFYISEDGLVYVFNQYEIAPYSMGQTEVTVPFSKLKPLMKEGNIVEYLYKNAK